MNGQTPNNLTSGRLLARNTVYNLIGQVVPLIAAFFSIPFLIDGLGTDRFGVLMLAWMVIGYFSLFDMGLGRALTKLIAEKLGSGEMNEIPALAGTGLFLMGVLGLAGTIAAAALTPWLVHNALKIAPVLQIETSRAFFLLALSIPVVISTAGIRGILEAYQHFGAINMLRVPMGVFTFIGPLIMISFSKSLVTVVAVLVAGRALSWALYLFVCLRFIPVLRSGIKIKRALIFPLFSFGGWMTISNIIGPLMVYFDRFLIGALVSMAAVAYYTTPYEVVTKLWFIPGALVFVLYPAFSTMVGNDPNRTARFFTRGTNYVLLALFPLILITITLSHEGLSLWIGPEFADKSTQVLRWIALGVFINSLGQIPYAFLQGAGRPDITAKLHLLELLFYLPAIWLMIVAYGIEGAAVAWAARMVVDALILFGISRRILFAADFLQKRYIFIFLGALFTMGLGFFVVGAVFKAFFLFFTLTVFFATEYLFILSTDEKIYFLSRFKLIPIFKYDNE
jgi:O-antigen/teichoic acid export membrane protein